MTDKPRYVQLMDRVAELEKQLERADRWIHYAKRVPDGACIKCFPDNNLSKTFVCAWHTAESREIQRRSHDR